MALPNDARSSLVAFNRFGYGPKADGELAAAIANPRALLKAEIAEPGIALLEGPQLESTHSLLQQMFAFNQARNLERQAKKTVAANGLLPNQDMTNSAMANPAMANPMMNDTAKPGKGVKKPPNIIQQTFQAEALARIQRAASAKVGLAERLVAFWSNHFCISARKSTLARIGAGSFEREAIRPHIFGRFADMVVAVEQHPVMLNFLDNAQSVGPNSQAGARTKRGLNENLAREIMELHTMGVGSGYTQTDVTNFAKILTGWSLVGREGRLGAPGTFVFNPHIHEPGTQVLLGKSYSDQGVAQGEAALQDIARRPATAKFIATKLVQHFVADSPPQTLVARLANVFTRTDGDLFAVTNSLIDADEAWLAPMTKLRTPYEFQIAALRATGQTPMVAGPFLFGLQLMGMELWQPPGPNGWPDTADAWGSPEGMKQRLDISARIANQWNTTANPSQVLDQIVGAAASQGTRQSIARAASRPQGFALLLMSPEMQRR